MADNIGNKAAHDYHLDVPVAQGASMSRARPTVISA